MSETTHCALIVVMELALHYESKGVSISEISEKHHIPETLLLSVVQRLCELGVVRYEKIDKEDINWLFLHGNPAEKSIYDIVVLFDGEMFSGRFIDQETGKLLPKSTLSHIINLERKDMQKYIRKRLKKINLNYWGEIVERRANSEYLRV